MTFPANACDFEGRFIGKIKILSCSVPDQVRDGTEVTAFLNLPSCAPYYIFSTSEAEVRHKKKRGYTVTEIHMDWSGAAPCGYTLKEELDVHDMRFLGQEITEGGAGGEVIPKELAGVTRHMLLELDPDTRINRDAFQSQDFYTDVVALKCDMYRLDYETLLNRYLVNNKQDSEQRKTIRAMKPDALASVQKKLARVPWEMVFTAQTRKLYKLHGVSQNNYYAVMRYYGKNPNSVPPMMDLAVRFYFRMSHLRTRSGHTCFSKQDLLRTCCRSGQGDAPKFVDSAFAVLVNKGAAWVDPEHTLLAFPEDLRNAQSVCWALRTVCVRHAQPRLRGSVVPVIPPYELTSDQTRIAQHIETHPITVLEGLPGTGKTALVTWCMNRYSGVMLVSFISMMVKALQRRCGHHTEAAHTIHRITTMAKHTEDVSLWLEEFDVLVVDEFSNVESSLFASLVRALPKLRKIVVAGDHEQLFPIGPGDPMGCMIRVFGTQRLTEVLRVEPGKESLRDAPKLISQGRAHDIQFATSLESDEPLVLLPKPTMLAASVQKEPARHRAKSALAPLMKRIRKLPGGSDVMNVHVVVLVNKNEDGRRVLNHACETVFQNLGMLRVPPNGGTKIRNGYRVYEGKKITFTQNYNTPIKTEMVDRLSLTGNKQAIKYVYSEPISNGELVCVQSITAVRAAAGGGYLLVVSDVSHPTDPAAQTKTIWLHKDKGVDPQHVVDGFASTSYKIQGNEYEYVIFWMKDNPPSNEFYTREHAYVAVSRGKSRVWCFGSRRDFLTLCERKAIPRDTVLHWLMANDDTLSSDIPSLSPTASADPGPLVLMDRDVPCVPRASETIAAKREDKDKDKNKRKKKKRRKGTGTRKTRKRPVPHTKGGGGKGAARKTRVSRK